MPLVSIIVPLHNKGPYVAETLASVRAQTLTDWEAIVVENGSTDAGPEIVAQVASEDLRISLVEAPREAVGPGSARNLGLEAATGDWVVFLDADDLLLPDHLESLVARARMPDPVNRPDVVVSDWLEFREDERTWQWGKDQPCNELILSAMENRHAAGSRSHRGAAPVSDSSIAFAPWALHCGLIHRDSLTQDRRWVERLDSLPSEDTAFWFRVLTNRSVAFTRKPTALYRTHTPGFRNTFHDLERWHSAVAAIHEANVEFLTATGNVVNENQAECLMRVWEALAATETRAGEGSLAADSISRAEQWLGRCTLASLKLPIIARKIFGVRQFLRLKAND